MIKLIQNILIISLLVLPNLAFGNTSNNIYYHIDIYFENDQIFLDRNISNPINITNNNINPDYEFYVGEDERIINKEDYIELKFEGFDSEYKWTVYVKENLIQGNNKIQVPYYPHAKKVEVLFQNSRSLELDLSSVSTCNQNNICEYENGETALGCIMDCYFDENTSKKIVYSPKTRDTLQANNGVIRDQEGTVLLRSSTSNSNQSTNGDISEESSALDFIPLIIGIILIVVGVVTFIYFKFKKK